MYIFFCVQKDIQITIKYPPKQRFCSQQLHGQSQNCIFPSVLSKTIDCLHLARASLLRCVRAWWALQNGDLWRRKQSMGLLSTEGWMQFFGFTVQIWAAEHFDFIAKMIFDGYLYALLNIKNIYIGPWYSHWRNQSSLKKQRSNRLICGWIHNKIK